MAVHCLGVLQFTSPLTSWRAALRFQQWTGRYKAALSVCAEVPECAGPSYCVGKCPRPCRSWLQHFVVNLFPALRATVIQFSKVRILPSHQQMWVSRTHLPVSIQPDQCTVFSVIGVAWYLFFFSENLYLFDGNSKHAFMHLYDIFVFSLLKIG